MSDGVDTDRTDAVDPDATSADADGTDAGDSRATVPVAGEVPPPPDGTGTVVWHRTHLRTTDHRALAEAVEESDAVCPLFVFDPAFYGADGLACDARLRFLHEAVASLDRLYAAVPAPVAARDAPDSRRRLADRTPVVPADPGDSAGAKAADSLDAPGGPEASDPDDRSSDTGDPDGGPDGPSADPLAGATDPGLTVALGDPVAVLSRFVDRGWSARTTATPTSRYGARRDRRVRETLGEAVTYVSGDGLVRDRERSREEWADRIDDWLTADPAGPDWTGEAPTRVVLQTGVTPGAVDDGYGVAPTKRRVPTGTHRRAATKLSSFLDRVESYPGRISAPGEAREGTSGLSPYLTFGLLSVRQVHRAARQAPDCRGREMFLDRLVWNRHYNQKLADWSGWTDRAVNPALEGFNEEYHDPDLVAAWKRGETGYPMVDAAMRCLRATGWLNFRMRAMAASFFAHVLQQPWWIGADWYHHHLVDSDVGINYTQWQSQAGLVGKPSQRVYNPRKQVRDQDPDGEWVTEYVPELAALPADFLDRPERTPLAVQRECGVAIGEDYPRPVVDFEARRERFWTRYERVRPAAARALARPEVARRASLSGGYAAARRIAAEYGDDDRTRQASLTEAVDDSPESDGSTTADDRPAATDDRSTATNDRSTTAGAPPDREAQDGTARDGTGVLPTGAGDRAGEPSPDDRAALGDDGPTDETGTTDGATPDPDSDSDSGDGDDESGQTSLGAFD